MDLPYCYLTFLCFLQFQSYLTQQLGAGIDIVQLNIVRINRTEMTGHIGFTLILEITPTSRFSALNNLDLNSEVPQFITIGNSRAFFDSSQSFNFVPSGELTQCRDMVEEKLPVWDPMSRLIHLLQRQCHDCGVDYLTDLLIRPLPFEPYIRTFAVITMECSHYNLTTNSDPTIRSVCRL